MGNMNYNYFVERLLLPLGDIFFKTSFINYVKECRKHDQMSAEQLNRLQKNRLYKILNFVTENSTHYKNLNIKVDSSNPSASLKQFPILTKDVITRFTDDILTEPLNTLNKISSSGSTGFQTSVYLSKEEISIARAQQTRWWEWAGYKLGSPILQTGMTVDRSMQKKIKDFFLNTEYVPAFALSPGKIESTLKYAKKKKISHFFGYASSLFVFAEVAEKVKLDIKFDSMVCWGDKMFNSYRKKIKATFGCDVQETYGSTEGFMIASQYDLPYLYIMTPWVFLELLDEHGNEVEDGQIGHVVVTSLFSKAFPLIRYRLGDLAIRLPKERYPKNRKLPYPLLEKVIGRDTDIVRTSFGKSMIVHTFTGIFEYYPEIRQFQVIQEKLDEIQIDYIPNKSDVNDSLTEIKNKILQKLGDTIRINFNEVSEISASPSGKPQIIKSTLKV